MTPKTNRRQSLGLAAILCGLLVPSAMAADATTQTLQIKIHQAINTLTAVDPVTIPGRFEMFDVGEATLFGRYANEGQVQMVPSPNPPGFAVLFGAGTLTAANGDTITWELVPGTDTIKVLGGTGRFQGATGHLDNFFIDLSYEVDEETGAITMVTIIHYATGELTIPKKTK